MNLLAILITKIVLATGLAGVAEVFRRRAVRPGVAYALWASVLAVLIIPSIFTVTLPEQFSSFVQSAFGQLSVLPEAASGAGHFAAESAAVADWTGALISLSWKLCLMGWIVGCLIAWRRRIGALRQLRRFVELAPDASSEVRTRCSELATELRAGQVPRVVTADGTFSPFLWDPVCGPALIVIPEALLNQFSAESLDAVLRHELIHLRRRDAWRHRVQFAIASVWWWVPTAALARRRLLRLEELCTDAAVVEANPDSANHYARALLDTEVFLTDAASRELMVVPAFTQGVFLRDRIVNIVGVKPDPVSLHRRMIGCAVVAMSLSLGLLTAGLPPHAENSQSSVSVLTEHVTTPEANSPVETVDARTSEILLPDSETVSVSRSDREIVLVWCRADFSPPVRELNVQARSTNPQTESIRLVRVSEDGVEPRVWKIDRPGDDSTGSSTLNPSEVDWLFGFLTMNNDIVDCDGTRHHHPGRSANVA